HTRSKRDWSSDVCSPDLAPDARVRVLLTASDEERMRRRAAELGLEDTEETRERMADQVLRRDRDDSSVSEFLTAAEGVEQIDTKTGRASCRARRALRVSR